VQRAKTVRKENPGKQVKEGTNDCEPLIWWMMNLKLAMNSFLLGSSKDKSKSLESSAKVLNPKIEDELANLKKNVEL